MVGIYPYIFTLLVWIIYGTKSFYYLLEYEVHFHILLQN